MKRHFRLVPAMAMLVGAGPLQAGEVLVLHDGDTVLMEPGGRVVAEASVSNTQEARWLAHPHASAGTVCLSAQMGEKRILGEIEADTVFLHDACVPEFELTKRVELPVVVTFRMMAKGRADFGEVIRVRLQPASALAKRHPEGHSQEKQK